MIGSIACSLSAAFSSQTLDFSPVYEAIRTTDLNEAEAKLWEATLQLHKHGYRHLFLIGVTRMGHIITLNTSTSEVQFRNKVTFEVETSADLAVMPHCFQKAIRKCVTEFVQPRGTFFSTSMNLAQKPLAQVLKDAVSLLDIRATYSYC